MDTRHKILSCTAAIETACRLKQQARGLTVVTGYFDVLGAAHVRDLAGVRKTTPENLLMVVLLPKEPALLSQRARAEMVAALSMIDYVVTPGEGGVESILSRLPADEVITRQAADEEQTRLLMEHVLSRHTI